MTAQCESKFVRRWGIGAVLLAVVLGTVCGHAAAIRVFGGRAGNAPGAGGVVNLPYMSNDNKG